MERPVVDPHMVELTFVHQPTLYVGDFAVANTLVYHFEQLYGHRTVRSGELRCGAPAIVDNPTDCFFNFCFQDLSHIQSFLIGEFNVSSMHVEAMSKELSAAQERISAAASKGGFGAADVVASSELSVDAQRRIAIASGIRSDALKAEPRLIHMLHSKGDINQFFDDIIVYAMSTISIALVFWLSARLCRQIFRQIFGSTLHTQVNV
jgi:hypothetical protein